MDNNIDRLVPDIQDLFNAPHKVDDGRLERLGNDLAAMVGRRLAEQRGDAYLRMSNLGKGDRQLWYEIKSDLAGESNLTPSAKIKFLFGDILELLLIFLAEEAGHEVTCKQEEVNVDGVVGHLDAMVDGYVVDCKSASTPSFKKFQFKTLTDNDSFGYMEQLSGYVEAKPEAAGGAFLAIDKTLGHIVLDKYERDELTPYKIRDRIKDIRGVLESDEVPDRCYDDVPDGESGNRVLGVNCTYCPFKKPCWQDANGGIGLRTFLYANGPRHFTNVAKEPKVMELTF